MCGICGVFEYRSGVPVERDLIDRMTETIRHRGPDDEGYFVQGPMGMGARRLAIIDLAGSHQPLSNEDGTCWVAFNGEIYNFRELRAWLERKGHKLRTEGDTEAIVHL